MISYKSNGFHDSEYTIKPFFAFVEGEHGIILNHNNGTTLCTDIDTIKSIENGTLSDHMRYRLVSLGFAEVAGSPMTVDHRITINPHFFLIDMTNKCNLQCAYCLRVPENKKRQISYSKLLEICEYILVTCKQNHYKNITIQPWGGEPLLCIDEIVKIREFFQSYPEIHTHISIQTNGTLLTDENLQKMKDAQIDFGVSVDGPPVVHDMQRLTVNGEKTAQKVHAGLVRAHDMGFDNVGGICVVTNKSLGHIREIITYAADELRLGAIKLNLMHQPDHDCADIRVLTESEITEVCKEMLDSWIDISKRFPEFHELNIKDRLNNILYRTDAHICHACGCCGGRQMVSFDMDGDIYPCELTDWPDEKMGNIKDGIPLREIIESSLSKPYFHKKENAECTDCPWQYYCRGGCSAAIKYTGHKTTIDTLECTFNKNLYPLLIEALLQERIPEIQGWR